MLPGAWNLAVTSADEALRGGADSTRVQDQRASRAVELVAAIEGDAPASIPASGESPQTVEPADVVDFEFTTRRSRTSHLPSSSLQR
jgi:hypothetical protein